MRHLVAWVCLAGLVAHAREAHAGGSGRGADEPEGKHHLGLGAGLSILKVDDKTTHSIGPGLALHYAYQITDALRFIGEGTSFIVAKDEDKGPEIPHTRPTRVDTFGLGMGYVLDITRKWVPYGGVMATGTALTGGTLDNAVLAFGVQLAVGVDYMLTSHFAIGFAFRQHLLLTKMSTYTSYYAGFLRAEFVWGK
ncbi:outer membrane beta-barrel protein [Pendulispora albinea]|uniref:Porin family protein n=1 Tax=Pendulispora albinea TaxID=2741071 RepID=A0ABZ2M0L9_9BACT